MPPDARHAEALKWLASACGDLRGGEVLLRSDAAPARLAAFLAQQSAEKSLKAGLFAVGVPVPRSHRLDRLRELLPDHWSVHQATEDLVELTAYSTAARYPDAEASVDHDDADEALDLARRVYEAITLDIAREGVDVSNVPCD